MSTNVSGFSADTLPDSDHATEPGRAAHFVRLTQDLRPAALRIGLITAQTRTPWPG
ncbi:hypothetical protein EMIT093MI4_190035 [Pseudomonas sp. IT-93MI4]